MNNRKIAPFTPITKPIYINFFSILSPARKQDNRRDTVRHPSRILDYIQNLSLHMRERREPFCSGGPQIKAQSSLGSLVMGPALIPAVLYSARTHTRHHTDTGTSAYKHTRTIIIPAQDSLSKGFVALLPRSGSPTINHTHTFPSDIVFRCVGKNV